MEISFKKLDITIDISLLLVNRCWFGLYVDSHNGTQQYHLDN
jgi:hypothetical protein